MQPPGSTRDSKKFKEGRFIAIKHVGSVTYGTPYIRSGIIVNSNGVLVSEPSTGAELGRIEEVFSKDES